MHKTQQEMADAVGVNVRTIKNWKAEGVDVTDLRAVQARAAGLGKRTKDAEDLQSVKLRKLKAEADLKEHELEVERGTVVRREEMNSDGMKIGMVVKSVFQKFSSDLTPILAGRPAGEVKKALDKYAREKLVELSQYDSYVKIPID